MQRWIFITILLAAWPARARDYCHPSLLDVPVGVEITPIRDAFGTLDELDFHDVANDVHAQAMFFDDRVSFHLCLGAEKFSRPRSLYGRDVVRLALALAERPVRYLVGNWLSGENLRIYNALTARGWPGGRAAAATWTGRAAARHGFTAVELIGQRGTPGQHVHVSYSFGRAPSSTASNSSGNAIGVSGFASKR